jgi:ABC-type Fe3+-siderophore transport system permease subunit
MQTLIRYMAAILTDTYRINMWDTGIIYTHNWVSLWLIILFLFYKILAITLHEPVIIVQD